MCIPENNRPQALSQPSCLACTFIPLCPAQLAWKCLEKPTRTAAGLQLWGSHSVHPRKRENRNSEAALHSCLPSELQPTRPAEGLASIDGQVMGSTFSDIKPCHVVGALPPLARFNHRFFLWVFHQSLNPGGMHYGSIHSIAWVFLLCISIIGMQIHGLPKEEG